MGKNVAIIAQTSVCLTLNKLKAAFKAENHQVSFFVPVVSEIAQIPANTDLYVVYLDFDGKQEIYDEISKVCKREGRKALIIGKKGETEAIASNFDQACVGKLFERPVNVEDFIEQAKPYMGSMKKKLLLIDDSRMTLRMIGGWLSRDFDVASAAGATDADAVLRSGFAPDLILLDYEMPGCSGPEYFERLQASEETSGYPVFFLTGVDDKKLTDAVMEKGVQGYLLKSMEPSAIITRIKEFLS